jgi:tetratricopeptide (TPR) repeat protein
MRTRFRAFGFALAIVATASLALSQIGRGRVSGSVKDTQGNPIPGATVTATGGDRTFEATTDDEGRWALLGFRTGAYEFTVTAEGFAPQAYNQQIRQTGRNPNMDFVLEPTGVSQSRVGNELLDEANSLYQAKQFTEAIAKYEELLVADPTLYQVYINIGLSYRELGNLDEAVASYEKVLAEDPMNMNALINMGDAFVAKGDLEHAVEYFEKAIDQTEDEIVPFNVAEIYFNQGNTAKALEFYVIAAERKPDWPDPHLKMGYAHLNAGDMDAAKASFEKVVEVAPDSQQAAMAQAALSSLK